MSCCDCIKNFAFSCFESVRKSTNGYLERLSDALPEVLLIFIPAVFGALPHLIAGKEKFVEFVNGPDITLLSAVLFMDGWWKVRARNKIDNSARSILELFGMAGAMFAISITMILYLVNLHLAETALANNSIVNYAREWAYIAANGFAFWVRLRPDAPAKP